MATCQRLLTTRLRFDYSSRISERYPDAAKITKVVRQLDIQRHSTKLIPSQSGAGVSWIDFHFPNAGGWRLEIALGSRRIGSSICLTSFIPEQVTFFFCEGSAGRLRKSAVRTVGYFTTGCIK